MTRTISKPVTIELVSLNKYGEIYKVDPMQVDRVYDVEPTELGQSKPNRNDVLSWAVWAAIRHFMPPERKIELMRTALQEAIDYIQLDKDVLVESVTLDDDTIPDPEDQADVEAVEALLAKMRKAATL